MPYFDHNATTPLASEAREVWLEVADGAWENPSSPYRAAARVRNRLEDCRARLARLLRCDADEIVFFSGATEANNSVLAYFAGRRDADDGVLLSAVEHPCVREAAVHHFGARAHILEVDSAGRVVPDAVAAAFRERRPALVTVMAANNETGVLQPVGEIAEICRRRSVAFHCDAAQWVGKLPARELPAWGFLSGSAHKFGGPKGVGFLRAPAGFNAFHGQLGGEQEKGKRAGTENPPAVAAMLAALEAREGAGLDHLKERAKWRDAFEAELMRNVPGVKVAGGEAERLWNTSCLILPRHANHRWVMKLDREGFAVSTGSACSTGDEAPSRVLSAMGFAPDEARCAVRVSSGPETPEEAWQSLAAAFVRIYRNWEDDDSSSSLTDVVSI